MTATRWLAALAALSSTALATPAPGERLEDFAVRVPITTTGAAPYQRLSLPIEAWLASQQPGLRDVRIFNAAREPVPVALLDQRPQTRQRLKQKTAPAFPLRGSQADGTQDWSMIVHRSADGNVVSVRQNSNKVPPQAPIRAYLIDTGLHAEAIVALDLSLGGNASGLQRVTVDASDDLAGWQTIQPDAVLAVLRLNGEHIRREHIDLTETHARYVRLRWQNPAEAPALAEIRYTLRQSHTESPALIWTAAQPATLEPSGSMVLTWPAALPAERLRVTLPADNTLAPVTLSTRESPAQPWHLQSKGVIYRLSVDGHRWTSPDIALNGQPITSVRLETRVPEGMGSAPPHLSIGLTPRQLIFLARGPGPYTLALGNARADTQPITADVLIPGFETRNAPPIADASIGPIAISPLTAAASAPAAIAAPRRKAILWGVLILGVAVMAVMAFTLLRKTRTPT